MYRSKKFIPLLCFMFLSLQGVLWYHTNEVFPDMEIIENPPGLQAVKALSLGDEQFYFRMLAMQLQNSGDGFGRFTPLKDYDYSIIQRWMFLLDKLDSKSNFTPAIAAYYYSVTQYKPDTRFIVDYLDKNYDFNPEKKWWWLAQAVSIANHKLEDKDLALKLAYKLAASPATDMPMWGRQMPAFIHEQMGEEEQALRIILDILDKSEELSQTELNFMAFFINDRMNSPKMKKFIEEQKLKFDLEQYEKKVTSPTEEGVTADPSK